MLNALKSSLQFLKMSGAGNDFIIVDARKSDPNFSADQIAKLSNRHVVGCDQFVVIHNDKDADCYIKIYNSDGSISGACGNATRCVADLIMREKNQNQILVKTDSGILPCNREENGLITVKMGVMKFFSEEIPTTKTEITEGFYFEEKELAKYKFYLANIGNPHCVTFLQENLNDEDFFAFGKKIENHKIFPQKTNVEFAKIISDSLIEVRVFERGAGETLACGSGACAVAALAVKNGFVKSNSVTIRFKGGDLLINYNKNTSEVAMTGDFQLIFTGVLQL